MRFESQWPGDDIAAPACGNFGQENAVFESLGSGSKNWPEARRVSTISTWAIQR